MEDERINASFSPQNGLSSVITPTLNVPVMDNMSYVFHRGLRSSGTMDVNVHL